MSFLVWFLYEVAGVEHVECDGWAAEGAGEEGAVIVLAAGDEQVVLIAEVDVAFGL